MCPGPRRPPTPPPPSAAPSGFIMLHYLHITVIDTHTRRGGFNLAATSREFRTFEGLTHASPVCVRWCLLIGGHYWANWERRRGENSSGILKMMLTRMKPLPDAAHQRPAYDFYNTRGLLNEVPGFLLVSASDAGRLTPLGGGEGW